MTWNNFCAVVEDLFWFAISGLKVTSPSNAPLVSTPTLPLPRPVRAQLSSPHTPTLLAAPVPPPAIPTTSDPVSLETITSLPTISPTPTEERDTPTDTILHAPVVMYVMAPMGTDCLHSPRRDFDVVIDTLVYGTAVTVIGYQGRFASVNRSNITGWVAKDDITPHKQSVWPVFVPGTTYDATHTETGKTRLLIDDSFTAGNLALSLQAGEYITVRLKSENSHIPWSYKRPRVAGTWAQLLRGTKGVHITVTPKTDSIMEFTGDDGIGRLGFVEMVAPDLSLTVSAVGLESAGQYTVKTMSAEVWRELRPVFIEVA